MRLEMPDGRILSRCNGGTLRLWDGLSGMPGPMASFDCISFHDVHTQQIIGAQLMEPPVKLPAVRKERTAVINESVDLLYNLVVLWREPGVGSLLGASGKAQIRGWHQRRRRNCRELCRRARRADRRLR